MKKNKIFKIVFIGNLAINLPFILGIIYFFIFNNSSISFLVALFTLGYFYWSYMAAWYRAYSINRLNSKQEFFYWKKLSINSLLLWPENFILTKTEFWVDQSFEDYQQKKKELI